MANLKDVINDIDEIKFSRSAFGYKASEVDDFIDELQKKMSDVIVNFNQLISENEKLKSEIAGLRNERDSIARAIANSEQIAKASVIDAGVRSKYILKDASEKAARLVDTAHSEYEKTLNEAIKLNENVEDFLTECIKRFSDQIENMKSFSKISFSKVNMNDFQLDETAKQFVSNDDVNTFNDHQVSFVTQQFDSPSMSSNFNKSV